MTNKVMQMTIGNKIKKLRELKNFTQEYMAEALQMSQTGYGKIERSETDINYSRLEQIANVLGTKVADLISLDEKLMLNITNNANAEKSINNGVIMSDKEAMERERSLYEAQIKQLIQEIDYLKETIEFLKEKMK
jgi:transcriptional regulator with XRE-family HTH domain